MIIAIINISSSPKREKERRGGVKQEGEGQSSLDDDCKRGTRAVEVFVVFLVTTRRGVFPTIGEIIRGYSLSLSPLRTFKRPS